MSESFSSEVDEKGYTEKTVKHNGGHDDDDNDDEKEKVLIALVQFCATDDKLANWRTCERLIRLAVKENNEVQLVCLPENFSYLGSNKYDSIAAAEPLFHSPTLHRYQTLANELGIWLSLGGFQEAIPSNKNMIYNTHIVIPPSGEIIEEYCYRKTHLCNLPKLGLSESSFTGDRLVVVNMGFAKVGIACCFDYRFPLLFREYAKQCDIVLVPAACTVPTGQLHWECLLRARAIENQIFIAAAAQVGRHNDKRESYGHSLAVNAWGEVVASCGSEPEHVLIAVFDRDHHEETRRFMDITDNFDYNAT